MHGRDLLAELRWQAEAALARSAQPRLAALDSVVDQERLRVGRSPGSVPTPRRIAIEDQGQDLDGLAAACRLRRARRHHRVAVARPGQAPERPGLRRPGGLDRRVGDHRGAADGRPHARRADAAGLAPGHDRRGVQRLVPLDGRRPALRGRGRLRLRRARPRAAQGRLPRRRPALLLPAQARRRRSRHGRDAQRDHRARAWTSASSPSCSARRATPASSARSS